MGGIGQCLKQSFEPTSVAEMPEGVRADGMGQRDKC